MPTDDDQSKSVSAYIVNKLKLKRVYIIDDQEAYSIGLADSVQNQLKAKGVSVSRDGVSQQQSDFSPMINKIPRNTQLVYIPWQLPPKGKAFGQQMKSLGRGNIKLMGSDGLFDPQFSALGSQRVRLVLPGQPVGHEGRRVQEGLPRHGALRGPELRGDAGRRRRDRPGVQGRQGHAARRFGRRSRRRRSG